MRISDWSSDVCSSDLDNHHRAIAACALATIDPALAVAELKVQFFAPVRTFGNAMDDRQTVAHGVPPHPVPCKRLSRMPDAAGLPIHSSAGCPSGSPACRMTSPE